MEELRRAATPGQAQLLGGAVMGLPYDAIRPGLRLQLREERFPRITSIVRQELQRREHGGGCVPV